MPLNVKLVWYLEVSISPPSFYAVGIHSYHTDPQGGRLPWDLDAAPD
jgi:hypothetical protein